MKRIINPWKDTEGYHCYGCAPGNPSGLKMEFYEDGEEIVSIWHPQPEHQGWINTLHGGIQAALADEISSWVVFRRYQTAGVTSKMEIRYLKSISTTEPEIVLRAKAAERRRNIASIHVEIRNSQGELCTKAVCTYFMFSEEKAREAFHFHHCETEEQEVNPLAGH